MLLVFTDNITPRISYTLNLFFNDILSVKFRITNDYSEYLAYPAPKFIYSINENKSENDVFILSHEFLLEEQFNPNIEIKINYWKNIPVIFSVNSHKSSFPFDPFAAAFFWVTRYEEYLLEDWDIHGRFKAENSYAYKNSFLQIPVVNYYASFVAEAIQKKYPELVFTKNAFSFVPTFDIDLAFEIKANSLTKNILKGTKALSKLNFIGFYNLTKVISGSQKDPVDTFDFIEELHNNMGFSTTYFILYGKRSNYDINNDTKNKVFNSLLRRLPQFSRVGIHPTYNSFYNSKIIKTEAENLGKTIGKDITISRNHFLRMRIPETYHNLLEAGIKEDFTMGYASQPGFRAGTCNSFWFFDLRTNTKTSLRVHPFMYMDGTYFNYLKLKPAEAFESIKKLVDYTFAFGGQFISLWHNNTVADNAKYSPWRALYKESVAYIYNKTKED